LICLCLTWPNLAVIPRAFVTKEYKVIISSLQLKVHHPTQRTVHSVTRRDPYLINGDASVHSPRELKQLYTPGVTGLPLSISEHRSIVNYNCGICMLWVFNVGSFNRITWCDDLVMPCDEPLRMSPCCRNIWRGLWYALDMYSILCICWLLWRL
jgi:hypothetical protein